MNNKLMNLIKRGVVKGKGNDLGNFPVVQGSYMGKPNEIELIWPYGTHGNVGTGIDAAGIMFNILADEGNRAMIVNAPLVRPKGMKPWEFITGNFKIKSTIFFDKDGNIKQVAVKDASFQSGGDTCFNTKGGYEFKGAEGAEELMKILADLTDVLDVALVEDGVVDLPFTSATKTAIQAIKTRLQAITK